MSPRRAEYEPEDLDDDPFFPPPVWTPPLGPSGPVLWSAHLPQHARLLLEDLEPWVTWLADHYTLDHRITPPCWAKHWELIEELLALHTAWQDAYAETGSSELRREERDAHLNRACDDLVGSTAVEPSRDRPRCASGLNSILTSATSPRHIAPPMTEHVVADQPPDDSRNFVASSPAA